MKKTILSITIAAVAGAASAFAQQEVLVAGWDFEFAPTSYASLTPPGVLSANYSDLYTAPYGVNDGPDSAVRGTLYLNGTNGSGTGWTYTGPTTSASKNTSTGDIDWQIETRDGGATKLGGYGGLNSAALGLNRTGETGRDIAFVLNTAGLGSLDHVTYRTRMQNAAEASIDWSIVIGGNVYDLGAPIGVSGTIYETRQFDLSSIDISGASSVTLIGRVNNPLTNNVMLLDNLAVYGITALAAIPEPSTYAAILGLMTLGLGLRRRRHALAA